MRGRLRIKLFGLLVMAAVILLLIAWPNPQGVSAQVTQHSIVLSCMPSAGATGYFFYRGTASGGPYTKLNPMAATICAYTDSGTPGTFYYVATATDGTEESVNSNQVGPLVLKGKPPSPSALTGVSN